MTDSSWCPKCGVYIFTYKGAGPHHCLPQFQVYCDEWNSIDDPCSVYANTAQDAAEKFADRYDADGDYTVVSGTNIKVKVWKLGEEHSAGTWFEVGGAPVAQYNAREMDYDDAIAMDVKAE